MILKKGKDINEGKALHCVKVKMLDLTCLPSQKLAWDTEYVGSNFRKQRGSPFLQMHYQLIWQQS